MLDYHELNKLSSDELFDLLAGIIGDDFHGVTDDSTFAYTREEFADYIGQLTSQDLLYMISDNDQTYKVLDAKDIPDRLEELIGLMEDNNDLVTAALEFVTTFGDLESYVMDCHIVECEDDYVIECFCQDIPTHMLQYVDFKAIWRDHTHDVHTTRLNGMTYIFPA